MGHGARGACAWTFAAVCLAMAGSRAIAEESLPSGQSPKSKASDVRPDTAAEEAKAPEGKLEKYAKMTMEKLSDIVKKGKQTLTRIIKGDETDLDRSMRDLQEVVCSAVERARRLGKWDIQSIEAEAEGKIDATMTVVSEYLELVKDDGDVHQASKKIRAVALDKERQFREKADAKNSARYRDLAAGMRVQAEKAAAVWEAIRKERASAEEALEKLKECRELYVDVKAAQGIAAAVKELEAVRDDLNKMTKAMQRVQEDVLKEAKATADAVSK